MDKVLKIITNTFLFIFLLLILVLPLFSIGVLKLEEPKNVLGIQDQNLIKTYIKEIRKLRLENETLKKELEKYK